MKKLGNRLKWIVFNLLFVLAALPSTASEFKKTTEASGASKLEIRGVVNKLGIHLVANRGLVNAIYVAGGISHSGCPNRVRISGIKPDGEEIRITVDAREIVTSQADDFWVPINFGSSEELVG